MLKSLTRLKRFLKIWEFNVKTCFFPFLQSLLMVPGQNVTKLSILSNHNADSRATHPASSELLKHLEEAPLSRGELRCPRRSPLPVSTKGLGQLNSPLERGAAKQPGCVCLGSKMLFLCTFSLILARTSRNQKGISNNEQGTPNIEGRRRFAPYFNSRLRRTILRHSLFIIRYSIFFLLFSFFLYVCFFQLSGKFID